MVQTASQVRMRGNLLLTGEPIVCVPTRDFVGTAIQWAACMSAPNPTRADPNVVVARSHNARQLSFPTCKASAASKGEGSRPTAALPGAATVLQLANKRDPC